MKSNYTLSTPHIRRCRHVHFTIPLSQDHPSSPQRPEPPIVKPIASHGGHHTKFAATIHLRETKVLWTFSPTPKNMIQLRPSFSRKAPAPQKVRTKISSSQSHQCQNRSRNSKRPALTPAPAPSPQILEELNTHEKASVKSIDTSTPLIHIPFATLGLMVRFRPTRHYIGKNTVRNIKKIHGLILQLQSLN
jgi:hypothetical protein